MRWEEFRAVLTVSTFVSTSPSSLFPTSVEVPPLPGLRARRPALRLACPVQPFYLPSLTRSRFLSFRTASQDLQDPSTGIQARHRPCRVPVPCYRLLPGHFPCRTREKCSGRVTGIPAEVGCLDYCLGVSSICSETEQGPLFWPWAFRPSLPRRHSGRRPSIV